MGEPLHLPCAPLGRGALAGRLPHQPLLSPAQGALLRSVYPCGATHHVRRAYAHVEWLITIASLLVPFLYSLDALYGEPRDRGILFWKSMPVSDATTVLATALVPLCVLPLLTAILSIALQWMMLLLSTATLALQRGDAVFASIAAEEGHVDHAMALLGAERARDPPASTPRFTPYTWRS